MTNINDLLLVHLPAHLQSEGEQVCQRLAAALEERQSPLCDLLLATPELSRQLICTLVGSQYVLDSCCRYPDLLFHWLLVDTPYAPLSAERIVEMVEMSCADCETPEALDVALRRLRRRLMVAIIWRDLNQLSDFAEVSQSMTAMAESCIQLALDFHYRLLIEKHGIPMSRSLSHGERLQGSEEVKADQQVPQQMLVLGMGKLGGAELNVSSDIDLIFAFPDSGETQHESKPIDNQQFFTRLGQRVIKTLDDVTSDGFVFRVDMRLRPYGQSGALVSHFSALEDYYQNQGRDWERFAAIKARVVACSRLPVNDDVGVLSEQSYVLQQQSIERLESILRPFVYRKYIDFSIVESLRRLKAMIVQEVSRKGMKGNVKLGLGGIREVEFIVQSFQLIRGGRDTQLQQKHCLSVLGQLQANGVFDRDITDALHASYLFLRKTEHAIQSYKDEQTQQLPVDPQKQAILAWLMGYGHWDAFIAALDQHRAIVSEQFQLLIAEPEEKRPQPTLPVEWLSLWQGHLEGAETFLATKGCQLPEETLVLIAQLRDSWSVKYLNASSREALDSLMPQLLETVMQLKQPDMTLRRMLVWLEKIVGRSSYITLLLENPKVLRHLSILFEGSLWVAETLAHIPSLLDELLDEKSLYILPSKDELRDELRQRLLRVEPGDLEAAMEVLRYFRLAHGLRVAASDLAGALPLMNVSDYLTFIAEVVLEEVLSIAWQELTHKHGVPVVPQQYDIDAVANDVANDFPAHATGFIVVGYGKLGGIELSYSSDLDLVFIYNADPLGMTSGEADKGQRSIDNQTFYIRLGQKMIHILNTRTLSGSLYEVDMRLRPSGNSGLLVSSMAAFTRYQQQEAWTWEHQALVRARVVAGDQLLQQTFDQFRQKTLQASRDQAALRQDVVEMRLKMRDHLGSSGRAKANVKSKKPYNISAKEEINSVFHLKQDAGGIVDIEFMVQYAVLAWAHEWPQITRYTDNIRILEDLRDNRLVDVQQVDQLIEIYKVYRHIGHRLALQKEASTIDVDHFAEQGLVQKIQQVQIFWQQLLC